MAQVSAGGRGCALRAPVLPLPCWAVLWWGRPLLLLLHPVRERGSETSQRQLGALPNVRLELLDRVRAWACVCGDGWLGELCVAFLIASQPMTTCDPCCCPSLRPPRCLHEVRNARHVVAQFCLGFINQPCLNAPTPTQLLRVSVPVMLSVPDRHATHHGAAPA